MILQLRVDRSLIRTDGGSVRHILVCIEVPRREEERERLPLNIALVIDRSGSMLGAKLVQAREAARYAVGQLRTCDRVAVVAYDHQIDVLVPSTLATPEAARDAIRAIDGLTERGNTNLAGGWLTGCQQVAEFLGSESLNRCLLLTDGLANHGIVDPAVIRHHAAELRVRGVITSTFGIGQDFDEILLSSMAEAGGGNFRLIRDAEEIPHLLRQELWEGLAVVAPDALLEVQAPSDVRVSSLNDFPLMQPETDVTHIRIGDLVAEQVIEPVIKLRFPSGLSGAQTGIRIRLLDRDLALGSPEASIAFSYADHAENDAQARNRLVDRRVAHLYGAQAKREALALNRSGDFEKARSVIERVSQRINSYAGDDPELKDLVAELQEAQSTYARYMDMMARKMRYAISSSMLKERSISGSARYRSLRQTLVVVPCSEASDQAGRSAIEALSNHPSSALLGALRLSAGWRQWGMNQAAGQTFSPVQECQMVDAAGQHWSKDGLRLVLTTAQLADNWFSHWHPAGRTGVVSLFHFQALVEVQLSAFIAYEMLLHGLHNLNPRYDSDGLLHSETRGCLFDLCPDKRDLEIKLQNLHVCPDCRRLLPRMGITGEAVEELADVVRNLASPIKEAKSSNAW